MKLSLALIVFAMGVIVACNSSSGAPYGSSYTEALPAIGLGGDLSSDAGTGYTDARVTGIQRQPWAAPLTDGGTPNGAIVAFMNGDGYYNNGGLLMLADASPAGAIVNITNSINYDASAMASGQFCLPIEVQGTEFCLRVSTFLGP